jgi:hypothetical protein
MTRLPNMSKRAALAFIVLLLSSLAALAQQPAYPVPYSTTTSPITGTTNATSQLVAAQSASGQGLRVYLTYWFTNPTSGAVQQWVAGTGANCAANQVALTTSLTFAGNNPVQFGNGGAPILIVPPGDGVCLAISSQQAPGFFG